MAAARPSDRKKAPPKRHGSAKRPKTKPKSKRGGARPGAGRPRKPPPPPPESEPPRPIAGSDINGVDVAELARLGAAKETILTYLRVPRDLLQNAEFVTAFDDELAFGVAAREIDLLRERRDLATGRSAFGKVSATLAGMRNMGPNWDRVDKDRGGSKLADQQGAIADADKMLSRFRG